MYCRTCGNQMHKDAEICVKCGVRKNVGKDYCQVCGAKTLESMTTCRKCGAKLMKALSSSQMKKKAVSTGKSTFGTVLLIIGIILIFAACANLVSGMTERSMYQASQSYSACGRCAVFGGLFTGFGIRLRKKK